MDIKKFFEDTSPKNQILKDIYLLIHEHGPLSRAALQEKTKINKSTLARFIDELLKREVIHDSGVGRSSGGRRPTLYYVETKSAFMVGIVITRLRITVVLYNLLFEEVDHSSFDMTSIHTPPVTVTKIKQIIYDFMSKYEIAMYKLLGIGIAISGRFDPQKGEIVQFEPSLANTWEHVPLLEMLQASLPVRMILSHSATTSVLAEYKTANVYDHVLYCRAGGGIGCGVITNGELVTDKADQSTSYAHLIVDPNGKQCTCGKNGCLVSYTTPYAILEDLIKKYPSIGLNAEALKSSPIDDLIHFLIQEIELTREVVLASARYFGIGLANMINILQSELVIMSGPLLIKYPNYFEEVVSSAQQNLFPKENIKFIRGKEDAVTRGAAMLVFESYFES